MAGDSYKVNIGCLPIILGIILLFVLFAGEPDLHDAMINYYIEKGCEDERPKKN